MVMSCVSGMPDLIPFEHHQDPLLLPVQYNGQEYFTSQYFHRQYQESAGLKGKYRQHAHFLRLFRSIEAYALYLEHGDIVEVRWKDVKPLKTDESHFRILWQALFQANGFNTLTLLNATMQVALSHHLDDEQGGDARSCPGMRPGHALPNRSWQAEKVHTS